jgi:hypothetical protein
MGLGMGGAGGGDALNLAGLLNVSGWCSACIARPWDWVCAQVKFEACKPLRGENLPVCVHLASATCLLLAVHVVCTLSYI